jgi:4-hydroxymandelate oxidase
VRTLQTVVDIRDLEAVAAQRLDPVAMDYFRGGADDELTVADNVAAWTRLRLRPHVLRDVSRVSTATTVLGTPVRTPVLVAPTAYHQLAGPDGEAGTAAGAAQAGTVMILSTFATQTLEEVAAAAPASPRWFQLYVYRDRGFTSDLVTRAVAAGYRALVLTVDLPVLGNRIRDERNAFALPAPLMLAHSPDYLLRPDPTAPPAVAGSELAAHVRGVVDPALTFDDIGWLREISGLPVVVKGVLRGDDAARCVDAGVKGIMVSNHGGRHLDTTVTTAEVISEVAEAVGKTAEVYVDGGIRRGTDIFKALALGARAVMIGRPAIWGLAVLGADGVRDVVEHLRVELVRAMQLSGTAKLADITPDLLAPARTA